MNVRGVIILYIVGWCMAQDAASVTVEVDAAGAADHRADKHALPRTHALFLMSYGAPEHDTEYRQWNHPVIEHWDRNVHGNLPRGVSYRPPDDLPSKYYPERGVYSSRDKSVLAAQIQDTIEAGVEVLIVPWSISHEDGMASSTSVITDISNRIHVDANVKLLMELAAEAGQKVGFLIEEFRGRDRQKVYDAVSYLTSAYGGHKSFCPVFYIYDAHLIDMGASLMLRGSLRRGRFEGFTFIATVVHKDCLQNAVDQGYDGVSTFFATDDIAYGSNTSNWEYINNYATSNNILFIPSISPGYDDRKIRPWRKSSMSQPRAVPAHGSTEYFYSTRFQSVLELVPFPKALFINSFNDWIHGTQIEPATPKVIPTIENCDSARRAERMCKRLQRLLRIDGKYVGYSESVNEVEKENTARLYINMTNQFATVFKTQQGAD